MTRNLLLVLSAFTSLIAVVTLVDGALVLSEGLERPGSMLGVLVVGVLCWLRWRWHWRHPLLTPALVVGALLLASFAFIGIGHAVRVSSSGAPGSTSGDIMDVLFGAQAVLMFYLLWNDRAGKGAAGPTTKGSGTDLP